jgi:hypothetical protein
LSAAIDTPFFMPAMIFFIFRRRSPTFSIDASSFRHFDYYADCPSLLFSPLFHAIISSIFAAFSMITPFIDYFRHFSFTLIIFITPAHTR